MNINSKFSGQCEFGTIKGLDLFFFYAHFAEKVQGIAQVNNSVNRPEKVFPCFPMKMYEIFWVHV